MIWSYNYTTRSCEIYTYFIVVIHILYTQMSVDLMIQFVTIIQNIINWFEFNLFVRHEKIVLIIGENISERSRCVLKHTYFQMLRRDL